MSPTCSILMSAYNSEKYIAIATTSVLNQTEKNWELIILDDGSTDFTPEIASSFKDKRIIVYRRLLNEGKAKAMHFGLKQCKGRYVLELDADDWLEPNCLDTLIKVMNNQPDDVGMIYGHRNVYKDTNDTAIYKRVLQGPEIKDKYHFLGKMIALGPRFYKTSVLRECGGWQIEPWGDGRLYEDVDVILRIMEKYKVVNIGYTGYNIRRHHNNITKINRKNWFDTMKKLIKYYVSKWGDEVTVTFDDRHSKVYFTNQ